MVRSLTVSTPPVEPPSVSARIRMSADFRWPTACSPGVAPEHTRRPYGRRVDPVLSSDDLAAAAEALRYAEADRKPIDPLVITYPGSDPVDAYEIQLRNIRRRLDVDGTEVLGHKVGLSSVVMQELMGVDEPDYGHLLSDMWIEDGGSVPVGRYCYPKVEVEVGFLLGDDLPGENCTEDDVLANTEAFVPSIELVDSRIVDWRISLPDTVADNASAAGFVLGARRV